MAKLANWEARLAAAPALHHSEKEQEEFETRKMVSNALDRAQLYLSTLLTDSSMRGQSAVIPVPGRSGDSPADRQATAASSSAPGCGYGQS